MKNANSKLKYPSPSLTIYTQNFAKKKVLAQNSSTLSLQQSPMNSPFHLNTIYTHKSPNQRKIIKTYKSKNILFNMQKNKSCHYQNGTNINYINYPTQQRNDLGIMNLKNNSHNKNKTFVRPIIYKYNYGDNFWPNDSYFSYINSSEYNY